MSTKARHDPISLRDLARGALAVGVVGLALTGLGTFVARERMFFAYLFAFNFVLALALGSLAVWMIHNLTGGRWGLAILRYLEAATRTLPVLALLFVPVALGVQDLYPWASPRFRDSEPVREALESPGKDVFLSVPWFLARAVLYFGLWNLIAFLLNRWSSEHERTGAEALSRRIRDFSGPGLILYGLAMTFAAIDWVMSLDPGWYSTIFGVIVTVGQMVPALGFAIAAAVWWNTRRPPEDRTDSWVFIDLGSLMLAFVMLWTYVSFSQFLLIWCGNLPEEITYYLARSGGGWQVVAVLLVGFYFAVPFLVLLARRNKSNTDRLLAVTSLLVVMSAVHQYWLVLPTYRQQRGEPPALDLHWLDFTALAGLSGVWLATFVWQLQRRPLTPPRPLVEPEVARTMSEPNIPPPEQSPAAGNTEGTDHAVRHERTDANVNAIVVFSLSLAGLLIVVHVLLHWMFGALQRRDERLDPGLPAVARDRTKFPQDLKWIEQKLHAPVLQRDAEYDLAKLRQAEEAKLNPPRPEWVDRKTQTVHIAVIDAMRRLEHDPRLAASAGIRFREPSAEKAGGGKK